MKNWKFVIHTSIFIVCIVLIMCGCDYEKVALNDNVVSVYINDADHRIFASAFSEFKSNHPDITLEFVYHDTREERKKISTQIMAGEGPDVLLLSDDGLFSDINKALNSGNFANITQYIEKDDGIAKTDFFEPLLYPCERDDQLLALPLRFNLPLIITTQETLDKYNIPLCQGDNFKKINSEIIFFCKSEINSGIPLIGIVNEKLHHSWFPFVDWLMPMKRGEVQLDKENYLVACDAFKAMSLQNQIYDEWGVSESVDGLKEDKFIFDVTNYRTQLNVLQALALLNDTHDPVILPISTTDEGYVACIELSVAINANSEQKDSAYDLIKTMAQHIPHDGSYGNFAMWEMNEMYIMKTKLQFDNGYLYDVSSDASNENPPISPPQASVYENLKSIYEMIDPNTVYFSTENNEAIFDKFQPYIEGDETFDNCFESAKETAEIYISE